MYVQMQVLPDEEEQHRNKVKCVVFVLRVGII